MESVRQIKEWFTKRSENRLLQKFISGRDAETLIASHDALLAALRATKEIIESKDTSFKDRIRSEAIKALTLANKAIKQAEE
jgi:rRNA-processing protein FCF1